MYLLDVQCSSAITDMYNAGFLTLMGVDDATWLMKILHSYNTDNVLKYAI